jgi:hypothetical protein
VFVEYAYQYCFSRMHTGRKFPKRNQEIVETEAKSKLRTDMTAYFPVTFLLHNYNLRVSILLREKG